MTILSVTDASRMAGVPRQIMMDQISRGKLSCTPDGIDVGELIRVYPSLKPLANLKLKQVKQSSELDPSAAVASMVSRTLVDVALEESTNTVNKGAQNNEVMNSHVQLPSDNKPSTVMKDQNDTVQLLVRELEWNKELLEQTNKQMAKQLAEQRAMIADQARRLDDKDRFWARQVEIAQSLLAAPEPQKRKKLFGIF